MISVRLDKQLEKISKDKSTSKSQIIKESLMHYFNMLKQEQKQKSPYELGREFFGKYSSGKGNLSTNYKQKLKDKINAKNSHR